MEEKFEYAVVSLFGYDEPILTEDLLAMYPDLSRQAVYKKIESAVSHGFLSHYDRGVYYIPQLTRFGTSRLAADKVVKRRWLRGRDGGVLGYVTGAALANQVGVSEQVPAVLEVVTNRETTRVREVRPFGGWRKILLRRPRCEVTAENVDALRFLDLVTVEPVAAMEEHALEALGCLAAKAGRAQIYSCAADYPAKTAKSLVECERCHVFA